VQQLLEQHGLQQTARLMGRRNGQGTIVPEPMQDCQKNGETWSALQVHTVELHIDGAQPREVATWPIVLELARVGSARLPEIAPDHALGGVRVRLFFAAVVQPPLRARVGAAADSI
jgi:hypothetical protein